MTTRTTKPAVRTGPRTSVVQMTPNMAKKLLAANTRNRNLRPSKVEALTRDIRSGSWQQNGETIKVAASGALLDGQHRLHAVVKANMTVPMVIVTGLEDAAQNTVDTGLRRTFGDQLRMDSTKNASITASLARRLVMWENGHRFNSGNYIATESEMRSFLEKHPEIQESASVADAGRKMVRIPPSVLGVTHFLFSKIDPIEAKVFFTKFVDGIGLEYGEPAYALRKRIAEDVSKGGKTGTNGRVHESDMLALVIHAWNLTRQGKRVTKLQAPKGGWNKDNFPLPV